MNSGHARKKECTVNTCSSNTHVQLSPISRKYVEYFPSKKNWRIAFLDNEELIFSIFPGYSICCFLLNSQRHLDLVSISSDSQRVWWGEFFFPDLLEVL